ncbi:YkgJ family cysteine cluster protein [Roseibium sp. CAU 1637]|uniref:YkgJ family cysteine cluster protein n=1 Tax=Roseibium limicola TaxID=2816037 RepID=A0A939EK08_9HYPH|nr:YkgJ family cysteine cluster protein [Roseibium limicola]MBO0343635.1 YkgJ family cysteine cluster protein [Roseibium limicola]
MPNLSPQRADVNFACVGCGKCCTGHHVPLTLGEARQWAADGGQIVILVEALLESSLVRPWGKELAHVVKRSQEVLSGQTQAHVAINLAAFNPAECMHLDDDKRCRIYERRPLVCRIYPMEIVPDLVMLQEEKDCPPEAWQQSEPYLRNGLPADAELARLIVLSRQTNYEQVSLRAAICAELGIGTAALKGDGFTAYFPDMTRFADALDKVSSAREVVVGEWDFAASSVEIAEHLAAQGAALTQSANSGAFQFIPVTSAT